MSYTVGSVESNVCENGSEKDVGVLTSNSMLWTDKINSSIRKANKIICSIARNVILKG